MHDIQMIQYDFLPNCEAILLRLVTTEPAAVEKKVHNTDLTYTKRMIVFSWCDNLQQRLSLTK